VRSRPAAGTVPRRSVAFTEGGGMRRALLATLLGMCGLLLWAPAPSSATVTYIGYVGCSSSAEAPPSHVCRIGEEPGAFFESPEEEIEYEVCVTFPERGTLCAEEQLAEAGELYVNVITTEVPGNHLVSWYVGGVEVAAWSFRMELPPEPEPTPVIPPTTTPPATITTPTTTTPTQSTLPPAAVAPTPAPKARPTEACLKDRRTVTSLARRFNQARSSKRRKAIQRLLRRAHAVSSKAC
jgi:hypothetical protein